LAVGKALVARIGAIGRSVGGKLDGDDAHAEVVAYGVHLGRQGAKLGGIITHVGVRNRGVDSKLYVCHTREIFGAYAGLRNIDQSEVEVGYRFGHDGVYDLTTGTTAGTTGAVLFC